MYTNGNSMARRAACAATGIEEKTSFANTLKIISLLASILLLNRVAL